MDGIDSWSDPNPDPIVEKVGKFYVVRDDLLDVGSKARSLDFLIGHHPTYAHVREWVFGSCPFCGYAQISLPVVCRKYDKIATLFMAARKPENFHEYQKRAINLGAIINWVPNGMLAVTEKRARDYAAEKPYREVLPIGLEHPIVIQSIAKVARNMDIYPDEFWVAGSSGTMNRGLQQGWPKAKAHVVQVGHKMSQRQVGNAMMFSSPYKFDKPVKPEDAPPFPSASNYDAKVWSIMRDHYAGQDISNKTILFWNIGA